MEFNVDDFEILDSYSRRGKTVTLRAKLFDSVNEEINRYGLVEIRLNENRIFISLLSFEFGDITLSESDILKLEGKILKSPAYEKALKSFNKKK